MYLGSYCIIEGRKIVLQICGSELKGFNSLRGNKYVSSRNIPEDNEEKTENKGKLKVFGSSDGTSVNFLGDQGV